ncbi:MAG: cold shock domain-containing protein [Myxococcales bacterium]|nr:cold shock domain-containing protein [Myxococcales bacterium]
MTGRVKWFSDAKGYGFVTSDDRPGQDIFVHHTVILQDGFRTLAEGDTVDFDLVEGPKGLHAEAVKKLEQQFMAMAA